MKIISAAIVAAALAAPAFAQNNPPAAKVEDLGSGIHVIFGQGGNIGVSTGPDGAFVIDDQYQQSAAANLAKIKELAGGAPKYLVNTHWHADHAGGNVDFGKAGAMIFAHENVRKRLDGEVKSAFGGQDYKPGDPIGWPVVTFTDGVDFFLNGETVQVFKVRASHTDGDSMVWFKEPDILHMGDVFFNGLFPVIDVGSGGSVKGYLAAMQDAYAKVNDKTKIIPGHGEVGDKAALKKQIDMLDGAIKAVEARIKAGDTLEQVTKKKVLAPWSKFAWSFINEDKFTATLYDGLKAK
jgi:glyoxylase-like metal-dependent hydrolase (beta-lactamase superfamily II)